MVNIHDIAEEIMSSFSENETGTLIATLEVEYDPIDYIQIWSYFVCLNIDGINKGKFELFEIGDGIGSIERHRNHMQMTIYLTDYLSNVIEGYLNILKCEVTKTISMDEPINSLSIPSGFVQD